VSLAGDAVEVLTSTASFHGGSTGEVNTLCEFDPDIPSGSAVVVGSIPASSFTSINKSDLSAFNFAFSVNSGSAFTGGNGLGVRRLTQWSGSLQNNILMVLAATGSETVAQLSKLMTGSTGGSVSYPQADLFSGSALATASAAAPDFTGTVSEWYETLLETVNDVSANIHRKTLRGGANFIVTSPEVTSILEFTAGFRANVTVDENKGVAGAEKVGNLSKKLDVYIDPYFPRNLILVGRKGNSFLESGYVYAPYVPLQVTPTIFGIDDFVPRKGVMTRYAKKMVRPDMYGLVVVRGLLGESGS
jgi:hypothetical protein